jgi:hypothetical protein
MFSFFLLNIFIFSQIYTLNIDNPADCAKKFISNNHVGLILFGGILLGVVLQNPETVKVKDPMMILQSLTRTQVQMQENK